jgi:hypothetical protein
MRVVVAGVDFVVAVAGAERMEVDGDETDSHFDHTGSLWFRTAAENYRKDL